MSVGLEKMMTCDEVAELLQVSTRTIRKWVHSESMPVVKIGRTVRFSASDIGRWVDERKKQERTWNE